MATSYGIDLTSQTSYLYVTSYGGYFESPLYVVGTNKNKRTFTQIEWQLVKELATGEGLQIKYRVNLNDSWTLIRTYIYSGTKTATNKIVGAVSSDNDTATIPPCENIQIRGELLGTATTTPQFKYLILR
jgi:hypothetical protein